MSSTSSDPDAQLFGWELLCNSVRSDLTSNSDILLCFTHLVLVRQGFKCIGLGDSAVLQGDEPKSESLPSGWKDTQSLRYVYKGKLYNLKATRVDDGVMLNLVRPDERSVSVVHLEDKLVVNRNIGAVEDMVPDYKGLVKVINSDLIEKVTLSKNTKEQPSQTDPVSTNSHPIHTPHHDRPAPFLYNPTRPLIDPIGPMGGIGRDVGRDDLIPAVGGGLLGGPGRMGGGVPDLGIFGGGGMLFEPPRGGRMPGGPMGPGNLGVPGGSIPPGARFDPFRPPEPDRFPGPARRPNAPDNDEFGPPGWDDMYM